MDEATSQVVRQLQEVPEETIYQFGVDQARPLKLGVARTGFRGVLIRGPRLVDLAARREIPLLVLHQNSFQREWEARYRLNAMAHAVDLDRGVATSAAMFLGNEYYDPKNVPWSGTGPAPEEGQDEWLYTMAGTVDLRSVLKLPPRPARYAVSVTVFDWLSNTVTLELADPGQEPRKPEDYFLPRALAAEVAAMLRDAAQFLPPALDEPQQEGLALSAPAEASAAGIPVQLAMKLPAPAGAIVAPGEPGGLPAAVLNAHLLLVRLDQRSRVEADIPVPVYSEAPLSPGEVLSGRAGVDLKTYVRGPLHPGAYCLYLFAGEHVAGPRLITIQGADDE
jgi:hypothetical protein